MVVPSDPLMAFLGSLVRTRRVMGTDCKIANWLQAKEGFKVNKGIQCLAIQNIVKMVIQIIQCLFTKIFFL